MYKLFDSCKLDSKWKQVNKLEEYKKYQSVDDDAKIDLHLSGIDGKESILFKKNAVIHVGHSFIKYSDHDLQ